MVVVEDHELFAPEYQNVILVPLTGDARLVISGLALEIQPTPENGCAKSCWAMSHHVTATSRRRVVATPSRITNGQLTIIRRQVALAVGVEH